MSGAAPSLSIRHALLHVIMTFEAGTEAERRGHTADAVALLRSGTIMADSIIPALPAQHAAVLSRRAAAARNRMQAAHAALAAAQQDDDEDVPAGSSLKLGAVERLSTQPSGCYVEPPASAMQRPFWLLQQLASSIQGAAWLTPSLRVDKNVWLQDGGSSVLSHVGEKSRYLEALCRSLEPAAALSADDPGVTAALDSCLAGASQSTQEFEQVALRSDGRVEQLGRLERGMRSFLSKSRGVLKTWNMQQDTSQGTYVAWAFRLCHAGAGLERVLLEAHSASDKGASARHLELVIQQIHRLSGLLLRGPCRFLVEDVLLLADRSATERRANFGRLNIQWV